MQIPEWAGHRAAQARVIIGRTLPAPCGRCGETIHPDPPGTPPGKSGWVVGHIIGRGVDPSKTWDLANMRPEHRACSDKTGQRGVIEKAQADTLRALGLDATPFIPVETPRLTAPPRPFSLVTDERLGWTEFCQRSPAWLSDYLVMDDNANPPLAVSPIHPDAVGTYADEAIGWIEDVEQMRLRWWQRLGLALKLQHDDQGRLLKRVVIETAPRRAGKSVGIRGLALWRMEHGLDLFGERQEIVHTGSDLAVCRKVQKAAWRWAESHWGNRSVTRGNGKEAIERLEDGSVWLVRAQDACYGWDTTLGLSDETWDVRPDTVSEGLEPSLMGRQSPQLVMTSTAHRRARSTMRTALSTALATDDPSTLLLWWGAPPGADISDPEVWKAASPYWDEERAEFVASMYAKALRGESDPEFDDPDPLRGFAAQYCNRWDLRERGAPKGQQIVTEDDWQALQEALPARQPDAVAVESWPGSGVSVAEAWHLPDRVLVSVADHETLAEAVAAIVATGYSRSVLVGANMLTDPALKPVRAKAAKGRVAQAVADLADLIREDRLRHDGSEHLTGQVLAIRTTQTAEGVRVIPGTRADAIKAVVWAASTKPQAPFTPRLQTARPGTSRVSPAQVSRTV